MRADNPYESPGVLADSSPPPKRRSAKTRLVVGFSVGAFAPVIFGVYGIFQFNAHVASLPPGTPVCGNPIIDSLMLIFLVAPILGLIGGGIARMMP